MLWLFVRALLNVLFSCPVFALFLPLKKKQLFAQSRV